MQPIKEFSFRKNIFSFTNISAILMIIASSFLILSIFLAGNKYPNYVYLVFIPFSILYLGGIYYYYRIIRYDFIIKIFSDYLEVPKNVFSNRRIKIAYNEIVNIKQAKWPMTKGDSLHISIESRSHKKIVVFRSSIGNNEYEEVKKILNTQIEKYNLKIN